MSSKPRTRFSVWYKKFTDFKIEALFSKRRQPGPARTIYINKPLPSDFFDKNNKPKKEHVYLTNQVITSKYTVLTFLPRNLLEQFRRVANIFFLAIAILQFFPLFSTISPGLVLIPLLTVLSITAIKDGWEDIKRHQSDKKVNHSQTRVLSGGNWVNHNMMGRKARTFVRGLVPKRKPKVTEELEAPKTEGDGEPPHADHEPKPDDDSMMEPKRHGFGNDEQTHLHWKKTAWEDIAVGDYVKIMNNEMLPADILICATSDKDNVAFIETKNLDGETNLKSRNGVGALGHLRTAVDCAKPENTLLVECEAPDVDMYRLRGAVLVGEKKHPVDAQNTLLRGTVLRNTDWVVGIILYTGEDTKIVLNSGGTPSKRSKVERQMDPQVFFNLTILALMAVACAVADSVLEHRFYPLGAPWLYGANQSDDNPSINGLITWAFALITFQNIVPISLYISIEFVRTCQALFIYFDKEIYHEETDQPTLARSWNLSDDLGQVEYIFSDKTGTLTQNSMVFRQCSIGGTVYKGDPEPNDNADVSEKPEAPTSSAEPKANPSPPKDEEASGSTSVPPTGENMKLPRGVIHHFSDAKLKEDVQAAGEGGLGNESMARTLNGFFVVLSLCHTVLTATNPETGELEYKAQSPDEAALVQAAADIGFVFRGRDREVLSLQTPFSEEVEKYELLNILEFTSARKRMSVVLRKMSEADNRLFLLTKGADNVIFERLKGGGDNLKAVTGKHLDEFASEGLRTLTLAYKVIPEPEYAAWSERYDEATVSLEDREGKIERVSDELERDLRLLGATAIEDRLQDGVPETIADLKRAGIKVWVATGDKLETAIAIGHSTNLISQDSNLIIIRGSSRPVYDQMITAMSEFFPEKDIPVVDSPRETTPRNSTSSDGGTRHHHQQRTASGVSSIVGADNGDRPGGFILVIDGSALSNALEGERHKQLLLTLATQCEGVICCRVSPLQKALVVKLVKEGLDVMTLAIGDGANDVSMIQEAHVGVGISGEEGLQAVNSSDYAIAQFRFLKRLLLVHGHWSYARNGNMILNFFYKNIVCIGVLWWFQIYSGWSSNYVFPYTYLLFWNSFWTLAPVIGIGLFDRLVDDRMLMALPELYYYGRERRWFGMGTFVLYMLDGVYQSAVIFFFILYAYFSPTARSDGYDVTQYEFSTTMVLAAVLIANCFNGLNTNVWTAWVFFAVWIGTVLVWVYAAVYNSISPGWIVTPVYGLHQFLFPSAYFWLSIPLTFCLSLLPRYIVKAYKFGFAPDDIATLRWIHKMEPDRDVLHDAQLGGHRLEALRRPASERSRSAISLDPPRRPSFDLRSGSRTDMSTGRPYIHRGFGFTVEEGGPAMQRMQTNLSERRLSSFNLSSPAERRGSRFSLKNIRLKKPSSPPSGAG